MWVIIILLCSMHAAVSATELPTDKPYESVDDKLVKAHDDLRYGYGYPDPSEYAGVYKPLTLSDFGLQYEDRLLCGFVISRYRRKQQKSVWDWDDMNKVPRKKPSRVDSVYELSTETILIDTEDAEDNPSDSEQNDTLQADDTSDIVCNLAPKPIAFNPIGTRNALLASENTIRKRKYVEDVRMWHPLRDAAAYPMLRPAQLIEEVENLSAVLKTGIYSVTHTNATLLLRYYAHLLPEESKQKLNSIVTTCEDRLRKRSRIC